MHQRGTFAPETEAAARKRYESHGSTAQVVVKAVAKAMDFDTEEYDRRVTSSVIDTAREVLFAQDLCVSVGTRTEYENWVTTTAYDPIETGSDNVENVAWHVVAFANTVVAATFQHEADAAVETVRRQAMGRIYRDYLMS